MEEHNEGTNSIFILVLAAVFLCLFMAGNASATTFPVDEAGISAYVKVSDSIDLHEVMDNLMPHIAEVIEVNPTYFIATVTNDDNQNTHLYVGADGWVIPYYLPSENVSKVVRWNIVSDEDPTPEEVSSMTTLEEVIQMILLFGWTIMLDVIMLDVIQRHVLNATGENENAILYYAFSNGNLRLGMIILEVFQVPIDHVNHDGVEPKS